MLKTNVPIMTNDEQRARVRAYFGRGGLATRKEIRVFAVAAVGHAIEACPQPKRRTAQKQPTSSPASTLERARTAPDEAICGRCEQPKSDHGKMAFSCPPASGRPKGQTFAPR